MALIFRTTRAEADLFEIWDYIAADRVSAADRVIAEFNQKFLLLAANPELGRERSELSAGIRSLTFNNYVIFYRAIPSGIEIVRILHGARHIEDFLGD